MDLAPLLLIMVLVIVGILLVAFIRYLIRYPANITAFYYLILNVFKPRKKLTPEQYEQLRRQEMKQMASPLDYEKKMDIKGRDYSEIEEAENEAPADGSPKTEPILDDYIQLPRTEPSVSTEQVSKPMSPITASQSNLQTGTFGGVPSIGGDSSVSEVQVSAYYPKEVKPADWQPVHAYMFRQNVSDAVSDDAAKQLGARKSEFRAVARSAGMPVQEGALVVATPNLPGFEFNPPTTQIRFYKDWHRFDFETRAKDAPLNQSTNGFITFTVEGIIVADVPISIYVGESVSATSQSITTSAKMYQAIFCSYSHQDTSIVERAERVYKALGLDFLRDVMSLKSGQEWSEELLTLISRADVFQLFWSSAAAQSQHVRYEWEHALKLAAKREHFIRPVYWETPNPPIPPELNHIHFAYQPDLTE